MVAILGSKKRKALTKVKTSIFAVVFCGFYLEFQELHREKVLFPLKLLVLAIRTSLH